MQNINRFEVIFGLIGLVFLGFFIYIDLILVGQITAAIAYVSIIGFGLLARSRRLTILFGLLGVFATIIVYSFSPEEARTIILVTNRQLVIMAIITITITSHIYMTRQKEFDETLEHIAVTDSLTNIANRRSLLKELDKRVTESHRYNQDFSIIMFDIDDFKKINDIYGHAAGDKILKEVTSVCKKWLRDIDFFGRYGGEEFIVICPNTSLDGAMSLAERIREAISQTEFGFLSETLKVTISIGVTELYDHIYTFQYNADDGEIANAMIKAADKAMYRAKRRGKNCVVPHIAIEVDTIRRNTGS